MTTYATFGEIMLRLSPPGLERLFQSPTLRATFGGAEANVAVSLSRFGHSVRFLSVVPDNPLGDAALAELRKRSVNTDSVVRQGRRLGLYFAEQGSCQRPSVVHYDRQHSAMAEAGPGDIDWDRALEGVDWFHTTGITPALSRSAADLTLDAVKACRAKGLSVSLDLNYRAKLWNYGSPAVEVMSALVAFVDIATANEEDIQKSLGSGSGRAASPEVVSDEYFERLTLEVLQRFPNLKAVAVTLRQSFSADHNRWSAVMRTPKTFHRSRSYEITHIVDRIGSGDAFAAGLLHGLQAGPSEQEALEFAVAASCLKHSIPGDFNLVSVEDVNALLAGEATGRIRR